MQLEALEEGRIEFLLLSGRKPESIAEDVFYTSSVARLDEYLRKGGNPNLNKDGVSLLHKAFHGPDLGRIVFLLAKGADIRAQDNQGKTPIDAIEETFLPGPQEIRNGLSYILTQLVEQ